MINLHSMRAFPAPRRHVPFLAAMACLLATGSGLRAQVIVDSNGFEAPSFTTTFNGTGELQGQPPASPGIWGISGTGSTATVQTTVFDTGAQAVRVDRGANSDVRWADVVSGFPSITDAVITVQWRMRVEQTTGALGTFGPFFGVEAYDDFGNFGLLGSLGVDATTGDVLFQDVDTGFFVETGEVVAFGSWHTYAMQLNFATHEYTVLLDDVVLDTIGFVDQNNSGSLDHFTDADIAAIAAAGDAGSLALTGTAYFDGFTVTQVPEPAGLALATLTLLGACCRRRIVR